jgi:hypothetical protein
VSAISTIHLLLWLGLPLAFLVVLPIALWRLWKKRSVLPLSLIAGLLIAAWLSLSPIFSWFWRRETMATILGQAFSPKLVYSHTPRLEFNGDGTSLYVFEIPEDRISSLTNVVSIRNMGLPKQDSEMKGWQTIPWRHAPFLNDTNDIQLLAFSGGADEKSGVSNSQLQELMKQPSTMFACSYKTSGEPQSESLPNHAYMVSFYILIPEKRQLVVIFSKI